LGAEIHNEESDEEEVVMRRMLCRETGLDQGDGGAMRI
jgi:hypothetical protein